MIDIKAFANSVEKMRRLQSQYFRASKDARASNDPAIIQQKRKLLTESKKAERDVDLMIKDILEQDQKRLFP